MDYHDEYLKECQELAQEYGYRIIVHSKQRFQIEALETVIYVFEGTDNEDVIASFLSFSAGKEPFKSSFFIVNLKFWMEKQGYTVTIKVHPRANQVGKMVAWLVIKYAKLVKKLERKNEQIRSF